MRIALTGIFLIAALFAQGANNDLSVRELMQDLGSTMLRMLPAASVTEQNNLLLMENLVRLEYLLKQTEPHFAKSDPSSHVTLELLQERLADARAYGTRGNPTLLRTSLTEAFALCANCHVQDRVSRSAFDNTATQSLDPFVATEFHYLTRNYASAKQSMTQYFETEARGRDPKKSDKDSIVLQRLLSTGVEIEQDLTTTAKDLSKALKHLDPDDYNHNRIKDWIQILTRLELDGEGLMSPIGSTLSELDIFLSSEWSEIRSLLNYSEQEAYWIVIRGELNRHLQSNEGQSNLPQIYYWLAVADRELQYRFYGSLSRAYLEACVTQFPGDPFATSCMDEYEFLVLISFSGSAGTFVPPEVNQRIQDMRKLILANRRQN